MSTLADISLALQKGKSKEVTRLVNVALEEGIAPDEILNNGLLAGMDVVGDKFSRNEVYVPEVLIAARAMKAGTDLLKPLLAQAGARAVGKVVVGTVAGDMHDIGKNLVKMMLEGKGLDVIDLGTDVSPEQFVQTAIDEQADIICCSALLTTTMNVMKDVVDKAVEMGVRDRVKIMVGGAPVTQAFCDQIGADAYTSDAASCANMAISLLKK